jgi:hypothetical protein
MRYIEQCKYFYCALQRAAVMYGVKKHRVINKSCCTRDSAGTRHELHRNVDEHRTRNASIYTALCSAPP